MSTPRLIVLVTVLTFFCLSPCANAAGIQGVVVAVVDSEIISLSTGRPSPIRVRLRGVSGPRNDAPMNEVALHHLADLLMDKRVTVEPTGIDQAGNIIGMVFDRERDIGMQMIRDGAARYDRSLDAGADASLGRLYAECETAARGEKRGIWQDNVIPISNLTDAPATAKADTTDGPVLHQPKQAAGRPARALSAQAKSDLLTTTARALVDREQYETALPLAREAVELMPSSAVAQKNLALILTSLGQHEEALSHVREALRLDPNMDKAHYVLALIFSRQHRFAESVRENRAAIRLNPNYAKAYYNLGVSLNDMGRFDEALAAYRNAERLAPEQPVIKYNLGWTLYRLGRVNEARVKWQEVIKMGDPILAQVALSALSRLP
ncbi:MAG: tetratricopeptide repeat protein [Pyrinomonadaceae bacterium]